MAHFCKFINVGRNSFRAIATWFGETRARSAGGIRRPRLAPVMISAAGQSASAGACVTLFSGSTDCHF